MNTAKVRIGDVMHVDGRSGNIVGQVVGGNRPGLSNHQGGRTTTEQDNRPVHGNLAVCVQLAVFLNNLNGKDGCCQASGILMIAGDVIGSFHPQ